MFSSSPLLAGCSHSWECLLYPHVLRQLWTVVLKEKLQCPEREKYFHTPKIQVGIAQAEGWDVTTLLASLTCGSLGANRFFSKPSTCFVQIIKII